MAALVKTLIDHWPFAFAAAVAALLWVTGPAGIAVFWPLILAALFAVLLWWLNRRQRPDRTD